MGGSVSIKPFLYLSAVAVVAGVTAPSVARGDDAVDLIGRGGTFTVVERNGAVQEINESTLSVQDGKSRGYGKLENKPESQPVEQPAVAESGTAETPPTSESAEGAGPTSPPSDTPTLPGAEPAAPEGKVPTTVDEKPAADVPVEETAEQKAAREEDVRAVRAMLDQGGAYFYDENNKPLSYQQVSAMIREGKVENIRAQGLHLSSWSPSLNDLKDVPKQGVSEPAYGGSTAAGTKKSVHEIVAEGKPFQETVKGDPKFDPKKYSAGTPENGEVSPLAVPSDRRPFREVLQDDERKPFNPKQDYTENY